jgi:hypothetical protein
MARIERLRMIGRFEQCGIALTGVQAAVNLAEI